MSGARWLLSWLSPGARRRRNVRALARVHLIGDEAETFGGEPWQLPMLREILSVEQVSRVVVNTTIRVFEIYIHDRIGYMPYAFDECRDEKGAMMGHLRFVATPLRACD